MTLPTRRKTSSTEKVGVNFVRQVVEAANCIFHEIHHENDYGNDAFVEIVDGEEVTGICVGVQVKSGSSYCTPTSCRIPYSAKQAHYWSNHSLGVLGVVFDPAENVAYWTELKAHCKRTPGSGSLTFEKTEFRRLDLDNFAAVVVPRLLGRKPRLTFELAKRYATSRDEEEHGIGVRALLYGYHDTLETWTILRAILTERPVKNLDPFIVYAFAHIPWHGDMIGHQVDKRVRQSVREAMRQWGRPELERLLALMDESGISRGSIGQSVYAIVDLCIDNPEPKLNELIFDKELAVEVRENGLLLLSYVLQEAAEPMLARASLDPVLAEPAGELRYHLCECGFFGL
jgi:hypothetical protein